MKVDINCDLGEGYGQFKSPCPEEIFKYISSANIACGYHSGDPMIMTQMVRLAQEHGVAIGAHPGFPDLQGFGRRQMTFKACEIKAMIQYQVGSLLGICLGQGCQLAHVKLHGAMYNMVSSDEKLAVGAAEAIAEMGLDLKVYALAGSIFAKVCQSKGLKVYEEVFIDRNYLNNGQLVARREENAVIKDTHLAIQRGIKMVLEGTCMTIEGQELELKADTLCIHGDGLKALELAVALNDALTKRNVEVSS